VVVLVTMPVVCSFQGWEYHHDRTSNALVWLFPKRVQVEFATYQEILHWNENKELYLISSCLNGVIICTKRKLLIPRNISCELKMHSNSRRCLWVNCFNLQNVGPTMLGYVVLICCDRLARACKCWANNVAICCIDVLRSFGRGFSHFPTFPDLFLVTPIRA